MFIGKIKDKSQILNEIKTRDRSIRTSFFDIEFSEMVLIGLDLTNIDFSKSHFKKIKFKECNLSNSSFRGGDFRGVLFDRCVIDNAILEFCDMRRAMFIRCNIKDVNGKNIKLDQVGIIDTKIENSNLECAFFNYANIKNTTFNNIGLRGCLFEEAVLIDSIFSNSDFSASVFRGGVWKRSQFIKDCMDAVEVRGVDVYKTCFKMSSFFKADFTTAHGLPQELKGTIVAQGGSVSKQYSGLSKSLPLVILLVIIINLFFNPVFWSEDEIIREVWKLINKGRLTKAEAFLNKGLKRKPPLLQRGRLLLGKADIYMKLGNKEEARKIYHEVVGLSEYDWSSLDARARIAEIYRQEKNYPEAIREYKELLDIIPEKELWRINMVRITIGDIYRDIGSIEEAMRIYQKQADSPEFGIDSVIDAKLRVGSLLQQQGKDSEALKIYEESLMEVTGKDQRGRLLLGRADIYMKLGNKEEARKIYQEVVSLSEKDWYSLDARARIAEIYRQEKNYPEAIREYKELLDIIPEKELWRINMVRTALEDISHSTENTEKQSRIYTNGSEGLTY